MEKGKNMATTKMETPSIDESRLRKAVKMDEGEFKRIIMAARAARLKQVVPNDTPVLAPQREAGKLLETAFSKGGLDIERYKKLMAQAQTERRQFFAEQRVKAAGDPAATRDLYRAVVAEQQKALKLLAQPFYYTITTLEEPFLIWELPHPDLGIWYDTHYGAYDSSVQFVVSKNEDSGSTEFVFYFLWQNDSDGYQVVNAETALHFQGYCEVTAESGFFSGDHTTASISASLNVIRWTGWTDPATGQSLDFTAYPQAGGYLPVVSLDAQGGDIFGDNGDDQKIFTGTQPTDWFYPKVNLIAIPGGATTMFEVTVSVSYDLHSGSAPDDMVFLDFRDVSTDYPLGFSHAGDAVTCEWLALTLLSPQVNAA